MLHPIEVAATALNGARLAANSPSRTFAGGDRHNANEARISRLEEIAVAALEAAAAAGFDRATIESFTEARNYAGREFLRREGIFAKMPPFSVEEWLAKRSAK